jgi:hypothetical protein
MAALYGSMRRRAGNGVRATWRGVGGCGLWPVACGLWDTGTTQQQAACTHMRPPRRSRRLHGATCDGQRPARRRPPLSISMMLRGHSRRMRACVVVPRARLGCSRSRSPRGARISRESRARPGCRPAVRGRIGAELGGGSDGPDAPAHMTASTNAMPSRALVEDDPGSGSSLLHCLLLA